MREFIAAALLLAPLGLARAEAIYQCEENGRKIFSQQPCGADAKMVRTSSERSVEMAVDMPAADIAYLCSLAMRAWERAKDEQRNQRASGYGYYGGSGRDTESTRRAFVLSHISNLERIAADEPELYEIAKSISSRAYYGNPSDYLYDAERARYERVCVSDVRSAIDRLHERYRREDEARYGRTRR